jgi:hypothetical protein
MTVGSCFGDGLREGGFGLGSGEGSPMHGGQRTGASTIRRIRLEVLEASGELLCLLDDLLHAAWHPHHLRNFGRAFIAWTITGVLSSLRTTPISSSAPDCKLPWGAGVESV